MEPPAGDAPAGFQYKGNPQAAAWRRAKLNFRSLFNASPSNQTRGRLVPAGRTVVEIFLAALLTAELA